MSATTVEPLFERGLHQRPANYEPLTPLHFLQRSAEVFPHRLAVVDALDELDLGFKSPAAARGGIKLTYKQFYKRCRRLASALSLAGVKRGDCVSVLSVNHGAVLESCFGVPMVGAVLNLINFRLKAHEIAFSLRFSETKFVFVHVEFHAVMQQALQEVAEYHRKAGRAVSLPPVVYIHDAGDELHTQHLPLHQSYESFLHRPGVDPQFKWTWPRDEWESVCLNFTSGSTGDPKGVVFSHRGLYLNSIANLVNLGISPSHSQFGMHRGACTYLWTLPMFHCTGWCFPYSITAAAGTHVVLRKVRARTIFSYIHRFGVTHMCGAPTVLDTLAFAPKDELIRPTNTVQVFVGGAPPPERVFAAMKKRNFRVTHIYGLTEVYGPNTMCEEQDEWRTLPESEQLQLNAQQGVRHVMNEHLTVANTFPADSPSLTDEQRRSNVSLDPSVVIVPVPHDGQTLGEVLFRGNIVMKGYLNNPKATNEAFLGGWFHSGDVASASSSGYIQIKDRAKDVIISGGENISSIEVQSVLMQHPAVSNAAVVAMPHHKYGETPVAFVELRSNSSATASSGAGSASSSSASSNSDSSSVTEADLIAYCKRELASYKCPTHVVFGPLPVTNTGKTQKFVLRQRALALAKQLGEAGAQPFTASGNFEPIASNATAASSHNTRERSLQPRSKL